MDDIVQTVSKSDSELRGNENLNATEFDKEAGWSVKVARHAPRARTLRSRGANLGRARMRPCFWKVNGAY